MFDYVGILGTAAHLQTLQPHTYTLPVLIVGSFFPSVYYGFYCYQALQLTYLSAIIIAGVGASPHI